MAIQMNQSICTCGIIISALLMGCWQSANNASDPTTRSPHSLLSTKEGNASKLESITLNTELVPGAVDVAVLLPPGYEVDSTPYRLLLWLHGGPGDSSYLNRELRPIIEAAMKRNELPPLVVATPSARRSFYMDYQDGSEKWETLILKQLIPTLRRKYNLRDDQKGTLIGGYSMGGMGSLRMAFKHPEHFSAVAAIAPAIEPAYRFQDIQPRDREYRTDAILERTYGKPIDHEFWQANHPPTLARDRARHLINSKLQIYIEVGNADELGLFRGGEFLHDTLLTKNVPHEYRLVHGAAHEDHTLPARLADAVRFLGRVIGSSKGQVREEIEEFLNNYIQLFNQSDAELIAKNVFAAPVMIRNFGDEQPTIAQTTKDVQKQFETIFTNIKAQGWKRSVINGLVVHPAGSDMAFVDWSFSRLKSDGQAIAPKNRTSTLTLLKQNGRWRIISVLLYADSQQALDPSLAKEVMTRMDRYLDMATQGDAAGIARDIYQVPILARGFANDTQLAVMNEAAARDRIAGIIQSLKAKGWVRFINHSVNVRVINSGLALVEKIASPAKQDDTIIQPPGRTRFTYVWIKHDNEWRLIMSAAGR